MKSLRVVVFFLFALLAVGWALSQQAYASPVADTKANINQSTSGMRDTVVGQEDSVSAEILQARDGRGRGGHVYRGGRYGRGGHGAWRHGGRHWRHGARPYWRYAPDCWWNGWRWVCPRRVW